MKRGKLGIEELSGQDKKGEEKKQNDIRRLFTSFQESGKIMRLRFLGANGNVTGSRHFVETGGFRFVVDCGMTQGRDFLNRNWDVCPEDPFGIDAVLLTHAHLDHCGLLPKFVQDGFHGKIYGTPATLELAKLILYDSAHIQEEDALFKQKRHLKEKRVPPRPVKPLYTQADVERTIPLFCPVDYETEKGIGPNVSVVFHEAGHVLGSTFIEVMVNDEGTAKRLLFSGDLGRADRPILRDPEFFTDPNRPVDVLLTESTYGDRKSGPIEEVNDQLVRAILRTIQRRGIVLMPVFAVERAQEMLYRFGTLQLEGRIPKDIPIFLDSPMAVEASMIFLRHRECFDSDALERMKAGDHLVGLQLFKTKEESMTLNAMKGPAIILSSAGMCNAGRIKHHLSNHIGNKANMVLFCGYQSVGTLGRQIVDGAKTVRINGQMRPVKAEIESIHGISGHADQEELLAWFKAIPKAPDHVFVVHGEEKSAQTLANLLRKEAPESNVTVPEYEQEFTV